MSTVRRLKQKVLLPDWFWIALIIVAIAGEIFFDSIWFVAGLVVLLLAQGIYLFVIARCPDCSGHFAFHRGGISRYTTRYHLELECKKCHAIWDTGRIRDDSYFNS